jgi:O-antigen/teichoic acid export membrane protein
MASQPRLRVRRRLAARLVLGAAFDRSGGYRQTVSSKQGALSAPVGFSGREQLAGAAISGAAWKGTSQIFVQATRFTLAIVLAHLLTPSDYGVAGMVLVFSTFVIPFADLGLGAALVQRRTVTAIDLSTVFWTSVGAGIFFTATGIGVSTLVSRFYGVAQVAPLFAALSTSFIITALGATQRSLLVREIRFRSLELRTVAGLGVGAPAAVLVAAMGGGAWAFVTLELCAAVTSTVLLWLLVPWRPAFAYSRQSLRDLGSFGLKALGARLFADIAQVADKLLIGRFVGARPLGIYSLSYSLVLSPMTRVVGPMQEVLFPTMSRIQDDRERLAALWLRVNRLLAAIILPALAGLVLVAPEFVDVVLGRRWAGTTRIIQVLAVAGLLQALQGMNAIVLQARNRAGLLLRWTTFSTLASIGAFVAGLPWGALGVAVAYAIVSSALTPAFMVVTARELRVGAAPLGSSLAGVAAAATTMGFGLLALRFALGFTTLHAMPRLLMLVGVGALLYVPLVRLWSPGVTRDVREVAERMFRRSP